MVQYIIVGLIVLAAAFYVLGKYLPRSLRQRLFGKAAVDTGCGSGCGSCQSGCETPADGKTVVKLHPR